MRRIKKLTIEYDDETSETFDGEGSVSRYSTYVDDMNKPYHVVYAGLKVKSDPSKEI